MWKLLDPDLSGIALIAMGRRVMHHRIAVYSTTESHAEVLYLDTDRQSRLASLQREVNQIAFLVSPSFH